jgi:hypothetical protein
MAQPLSPIDLKELLSPYPGKWVALSQDERQVVGVGETIEEAVALANQHGETFPVVVKAPDQFTTYLL